MIYFSPSVSPGGPRRQECVYPPESSSSYWAVSSLQGTLECSVQQMHHKPCIATQYNVLHCTAMHCTALQCTALHFSTIHLSAVHCSAVHCTTLRRNSCVHFGLGPVVQWLTIELLERIRPGLGSWLQANGLWPGDIFRKNKSLTKSTKKRKFAAKSTNKIENLLKKTKRENGTELCANNEANYNCIKFS